MDKSTITIAAAASCVLAVALFLAWAVLAITKPAQGKRTVYMLATSAILGVLAVLGVWYPLHASTKAVQARTTTRQHVKDLALAIFLYAEDNADHIPLAANWQTAIDKYSQVGGNPQSPLAEDTAYDYALNISMAGFDFTQVSDPATTVLVFQCPWNSPNPVGGEAMFRRTNPRGGFVAFSNGAADYQQTGAIYKVVKWSP